VAHSLASQVGGVKKVTEVTCHLGHALISRGHAQEAESLLSRCSVDPGNKQVLLLQARVDMYTGQVRWQLFVEVCYYT